MGLAGICKSTVSKLCKDIDDRVNAFLERPLVGDWPYLWLDATYLKQREGGRITSVAAIIAVAVNTDGKREIVGLHIGPSEADGVDGPRPASTCQDGSCRAHHEEAIRHAGCHDRRRSRQTRFQLHAVGPDGSVARRQKLRRGQMIGFFAKLPPCLVGMEACGSAHHWAREIRAGSCCSWSSSWTTSKLG